MIAGSPILKKLHTEGLGVRQADSKHLSRLLMVGSEFPPIGGGVSKVGESLASNFASDGIEVGLVGPKISADYARRYQFPFWGFRNRFLDLPIVLKKAVRSFRPDVCLFMTWWPAAYWHSCLFAQIPFAVIYHGVELLNSGATLKKRIRGVLTRKAILRVLSKGARHFTISDYTRKLLVEHSDNGIENKVETIRNGAALDWPAPKCPSNPPSPPYILFVGRLERTKGVHALLDAFRVFARTNKSHQLVLVGDGPLKSDVLEQARNSGFSSRIRHFQNMSVPELGWLYKHCEFLVLPSEMDAYLPKVEGFGLVILEAASQKKPSIGTISGGIPSAIVDGVTGLLVPECSPRDLCAAMGRLASDAQLRNRLGDNAYAIAVKERNWVSVSRKYLKALGSSI